MNETPHTLKDFDAGLESLRRHMLAMARVVTKNVEEAMGGLLAGNLDRCNEVIAEDEIVDQFEKDLDEIGMAVMMRFNPVATDLRVVISTMNMARTMERIGDHAVNIARMGRKVLKVNPVPEAKMLEPLYSLASGQLRDAIACYADGDQQLALGLKPRDEELDKLHKRLAKSLRGLIEERREGSAPRLIHLLFVARSLERIGDLAVNLGEEVIFIESAEDVRHTHHQ